MSTNGLDLSSVEFRTNPYPTYQSLREANAPVWLAHSGPTGGMWLVTRYQEVARLLKQAQTTKDATRFTPPEQVTPFDQNLLGKDSPDHTRLRALANQAFTPARVRALEPRIRQIADELLVRVRPQGGMEFMADFALPLPVMVIAELLGVPADERDIFHAWSHQMITAVDILNPSADKEKQSQQAARALASYLADLVQRRRQSPKTISSAP